MDGRKDLYPVCWLRLLLRLASVYNFVLVPIVLVEGQSYLSLLVQYILCNKYMLAILMFMFMLAIYALMLLVNYLSKYTVMAGFYRKENRSLNNDYG